MDHLRKKAFKTLAALFLSIAAAGGCGGHALSETGATQLENRGLRLVWRDDLEDHVGQVPTPAVLFGEFGITSDWKKARSNADSDHRIVARAPDGRASIQFDIPQGNVPHDHTISQHWTPGVTHAGLAVDVWIPEEFVFPYKCAAGSWLKNPGVGRWPIGLWIGGKHEHLAGGIPIAKQEGISVRLNRGSGGNKRGQGASFSAYIYYLNRWKPQCEIDDVRCSRKCAYPEDPYGKCYGAGLPRKSGYTPRGRWVPIELEVKMNTPGQHDGCAALWVDGEPVDSGCGMDFGHDLGWRIRGFYSYQMWHCDGSPKQQKYWLSNIRLYRE